MATRSVIATKANDQIVSVYCHRGDETDLNNLFLDVYQTQAQVEALIGLGDLSRVAATPEACETYRKHGEDWEDVKPIVSKNLEALRNQMAAVIPNLYYFNGSSWTLNGEPLRRTRCVPLRRTSGA